MSNSSKSDVSNINSDKQAGKNDETSCLELGVEAADQPLRFAAGELDDDDEEASNSSVVGTPSISSEISDSLDFQNLVDLLNDDLKVAFPSLVATILAQDFDGNDNRDFRKKTLNMILAHLRLNEQIARGTRAHMQNEHADVFPLVTIIKSDDFIKENGAIVLPAEMVAMFVATGVYDSRYRVLIQHLAALLGVAFEKVEEVENKIAHLLIEESYVESEEAQKVKKQQERNKKIKRYALIGISGTIGGVLIGLTGGLAAPLVAAGAGVVVGTGVAAGIATTAGAAILGSLFGVAGAGLAGYKMNKRVGAIEEFSIETLRDGQSLHLAIGVSGWIEDEGPQAFTWAWRHLNISQEQYCLRFESRYMLELGKAMDYFMGIAVSYAVQQTLMETALATLVSAIAWPVALVSVASVLDNPWNVCIRRSQEVGHHLAEILLARQQGQRPVTLLGFSLGARVIYHCLLEMSKRPHNQGIIEDVVLLGAPVTGSSKEWRQLCSVVGGRVINGYCKTDWMLKFLYRTMSAQYSIAGTAPVEKTGDRKIVNVNLSHIITGHLDYRHKLTEVLKAVGVRVSPHSSQSVMQMTEALNKPAPKSWPNTPVHE